ncbi:putative Heavy metal transport/detoxification superfamily protein [Heracleum sosnowskyi]|uniref:Heavy metal transport/detoxification superfamily protein n=1 Tax=Heracleum sosnowskyi TaxID=360622 RepID=A0AAD8NF68_9APIA|nr:putative Heavy metal transport/detoxification superfamily protein [Heracleum sosnowskyi]
MTLQKVVIRVTMVDQKKSRVKAMKIAATAFGVQSVALSGDSKDQIEVTGEGIDTVELAKLLRKKIGSADLLSVGPAKADDKKDEKKNEASVVPLVWGSQPYYYNNSYPVVYAHDHYDSPSCTLM